MTICVFWLLTYVNLGLALALGNRPATSASPGSTVRPDYRRGHAGKIGAGGRSMIGGDLLHLRAYPYDPTERDELADWVVLNDEPGASSTRTTTTTTTTSSQFLGDVLIDGLTGQDPRALQTLFFALSPTILDVMYPDYSLAGQTAAAEPFLYDEAASSFFQQHNRAAIARRAGHHRSTTSHHHRASRRALDLPILVYEGAEKESRATHRDDLLEQRYGRTDAAIYERQDATRDYQHGLVSKPLVYEMSKIPSKRGHASSIVGRRSIESPGSSVNSRQSSAASDSSPATSAAGSGGGGSIASQFMMRSARGHRQYDVPQIECPASDDGMERFACPTADGMGRYRCIDDHVLCDGFIDCPTGEDEDRHACMFYKTTKAHLDVLADALLRWARGG